MTGERREISIPVQPWFSDHRFGGRIILAAVEAMQLLASTVQLVYPHLEVGVIRDGHFAKLLAIPPETTAINALVELEHTENGEIRARLVTRTQGTTIARLITHCELTFTDDAVQDVEVKRLETAPCSKATMVITAEHVYQELVPFGPAYRTLQSRLVLHADAAWGTLLAPAPGNFLAEPLGSPFPLDGAMHAACVHGQRMVDFVPFPVGFAIRHIVKPTRAGERYRTQVVLRERTTDELCYDVCIFDLDGQVRETMSGLRMRDVSHGRIRPPEWIKEPLERGRTVT